MERGGERKESREDQVCTNIGGNRAAEKWGNGRQEREREGGRERERERESRKREESRRRGEAGVRYFLLFAGGSQATRLSIGHCILYIIFEVFIYVCMYIYIYFFQLSLYIVNL